MAHNFSSKYELTSSDTNFPARVILFDKPGKECFIDKHWHKTIEMNYVVNGDLKININNHSSILSSGEFALFNPLDVHQTDGKYENAHIKYLVVIFSYGFSKHYFPSFESFSYSVSTEEASQKIVRCLERIVSSIDNYDELSEMHILNSLINILDTIFTDCKIDRSISNVKEEGLGIYGYAKQAIEFINDHYTEQITLNNAASAVGLTPTYFAKFFKTKTAKTFMQYLNDVRMTNALADIQNYDVTETEAALNNGFPNVKSFISTFKRNYNCTLTEYLKQNNGLPNIYGYNKLHEENHYI